MQDDLLVIMVWNIHDAQISALYIKSHIATQIVDTSDVI